MTVADDAPEIRRLARRACLQLVAGLGVLLLSGPARGFAGSSAFQLRVLLVGADRWAGPRRSAPRTWGYELMRRTSAPARLLVETVHAAQSSLWEQPVVLWAGAEAVQPLTEVERSNIAAFLRLGGIIIVDDSEPGVGVFGKSVRRELTAILPQSVPVVLEPSHVVFKSFYIIERPVGRVEGPPQIEAMLRGGVAQVLFLQHDLCGALGRNVDESWALPVSSGRFQQRENAVRLAVNLAMYVLCSNYKDDQVHAPWLMRRRSRIAP